MLRRFVNNTFASPFAASHGEGLPFQITSGPQGRGDTTMKLQHTNNTTMFQVVGNKSVAVGEFATMAEANASVESVVICDSEFGTLEAVAPGETVSGEFQVPDPIDTTNADPDPFGVLSPLENMPDSIPGLLVGTDSLGYTESHFRTNELREQKVSEILAQKTEWEIIRTETVKPAGEELPPEFSIDSISGHIKSMSREMNDWVLAANHILNKEKHGW
jgi:hypothetical protein